MELLLKICTLDFLCFHCLGNTSAIESRLLSSWLQTFRPWSLATLKCYPHLTFFTFQDFSEIACALGRRLVSRKRLRDRTVARRSTSALFDLNSWVNEYETLFRIGYETFEGVRSVEAHSTGPKWKVVLAKDILAGK